jgi:hypothetical protein
VSIGWLSRASRVQYCVGTVALTMDDDKRNG